MKLLEDGYSVNTTVRSLARDLSYLTRLPGASDRLRVFEADLGRPESFQAAVEKCVGVFHVAHPMDFGEGSEEIEEAKIESAVNGTLGVLRAAVGSKTVKRVVVTSSRLAVVFNGNGGSAVVDERSWTDVGFVKESKPFGASYVISKTLAEKAALEFGEKYEVDVVTVITSWIHGPFLSPQFPETLRPAMSMLLGGDQANVMKYPSLIPFVHVDDAASAHIFLMEHPNAKGRYICSSLGITPPDLHKFLSTRYPQYHLPYAYSLEDMRGFKHPILSSKKLLDMGFKFKYGLEEMFDGAIESCRRVGLDL
nr:vestitone reductase [Ipomoea batatas]